jgi:hypothetical protein
MMQGNSNIRFEFSRQAFIKVPNIKFHGGSSTGSRADIPGQTDGRDGSNRCFLQLRDIAFKVNLCRHLKSLCWVLRLTIISSRNPDDEHIKTEVSGSLVPNISSSSKWTEYTVFARVICTFFFYFGRWKIGVLKIRGFFWRSWSGFYSSIIENTERFSIFYCNFVT